MGRIDVKIDDKLERKFRLKYFKVFGGKKGSLTKGIEAAIRLWMKNN